MTTPNIEELRLLAQTLEFSDAVRCSIQRAADLLQSQAERIKALEAECEVERLRLAACGVAALGYFDGCKDEYKSASLDDVLRLNKRCTDLRAELGDLPEAQAEMLSEIKQLRAQLASIAAAEPVAWLYTAHDGSVQAFTNEPPHRLKELCKPVVNRAIPPVQREPMSDGALIDAVANSIAKATRPMPAQDVNAGLVELREWRDKAFEAHPNLDLDIEALANAKGAK